VVVSMVVDLLSWFGPAQLANAAAKIKVIICFIFSKDTL
jgi:hypothetical protein